MPREWLQPYSDNPLTVTDLSERSSSNRDIHLPHGTLMYLLQSNPCEDDQPNQEQNPKCKRHVAVYEDTFHYSYSHFVYDFISTASQVPHGPPTTSRVLPVAPFNFNLI
jgi:hypothetical protein